MPLIHLELVHARHDELINRLAARRPNGGRQTPWPWASLARRLPRCGRDAPPNEAVHFAHREAADLTVDLYWTHRERGESFRVEVVDRPSQREFTLHPATGREAVAAYHHPFAALTATGDSTGASAAEAF